MSEVRDQKSEEILF